MSSQRAMNGGASDPSQTIIPFAPAAKDAVPGGSDQLDAAGNSILGLLHRAAGIAEENSKHALDVAHKLSLQLQDAEYRIKDLEADVRYYQDRADRAEKWLSHISAEIEQRFFKADDSRRARVGSPQNLPRTYGRKT